MRLQVAITPAMVRTPELCVCVVVDVLRATSNLAMLLRAGAQVVHIASGPDAARAHASSTGRQYILAGEVGGLPPEGFDYGNSPLASAQLDLRGTEVVFSTSNGTRAMRAVQCSPHVLAGSFLNASAVIGSALALAARDELDLAIVCSGVRLGASFALDDTVCAGFLTGKILARFATHILSSLPEFAAAPAAPDGEPFGGKEIEVDEGAAAAYRLYRQYVANPAQPARPELRAAFLEGSSALDLYRVGLQEDVWFCTQIDITDVVPTLQVEGRPAPRYPVNVLEG